MGFQIGVVGLNTATYSLEGNFIDFRDKPLKVVCDFLRSAKMIIGTSSGPMHLAALCQCPQLVFSTKKNFARYEKYWNPFHTPILFPKGGWQPSLKEVLTGFNLLLQESEDGFRSVE